MKLLTLLKKLRRFFLVKTCREDAPLSKLRQTLRSNNRRVIPCNWSRSFAKRASDYNDFEDTVTCRGELRYERRAFGYCLGLEEPKALSLWG